MKYLAAAALALLVASPALAQQAPGTDSSATQPGQAMTNTAAQPNKFMTNEAQNQWLAGNLMNKSVYNAQGKSIGDLKDVLISSDGRVQALVIGVGGFLGIGEKNVAIDYNYLEKNGSIAPNRITLNMTEQDLRSAPSFVRVNSSGSNR
ncbi:MAG: PRC-barrel domain-containing protein [Rhodomicrobium sp.]